MGRNVDAVVDDDDHYFIKLIMTFFGKKIDWCAILK